MRWFDFTLSFDENACEKNIFSDIIFMLPGSERNHDIKGRYLFTHYLAWNTTYSKEVNILRHHI